MLTNVVKYSGIHAKTCAMRRNLLTNEDYMKLAGSLDMKHFTELLSAIEPYKDAVKEAIEYGGNRLAIERALALSLYREYTALFSFMTNTKDRRYFDVVFLRHETGIIKRLIRRIYDHRNISNVIPKYDQFMTRHIGLDVERVAGSTNMAELIQSVKGTEFYDVLSRINPDTATLFDYEMQLDFHNYIIIHKFQSKFLSADDRKSQEHINGCDADLHNIMWIYRAKTFFDLDKERVFSCLIPLHYRLSVDTVKELLDTASDEEFLQILEKTYYHGVFKDLKIGSLEADFNRYMSKQYDIERKKYPYSLAGVLSQLYAKGQEIKNLTTIIECVRYKLTPQKTMERLNINLSKGGDEFD